MTRAEQRWQRKGRKPTPYVLCLATNTDTSTTSKPTTTCYLPKNHEGAHRYE